MTSLRSPSRPWVLLFVAVSLVGVNMRMTIAGVGPLLDQIAVDQGVPISALGILGSVPLITWALFSPLGHALSQRIGMTNAVTWALVLLALGTVWRSLPGTPVNLWAGTALIGIGLAISNVLMPAIIRRDFPRRTALVMGVYTSLLSGMSSVVAGTAVPISHIQGADGPWGWAVALMLTGVPLLPALLVWLWAYGLRGQLHGDDPLNSTASVASDAALPNGHDRVGRRIWGDRLAWMVSIYMGTQSTIFYVVSTWFVPYRVAGGVAPVSAGLELMQYMLFGIAGSMLVPILMRGRVNTALPALMGIGNVLVVLGIVYAPALTAVWVVVGGAVSGAALTVALMLIAQRARTHAQSTALSGMAQSIGYTIAAFGPITFGWLQGATGSWTVPFIVVWIAGTAQTIAGWISGQPRYVLEPWVRRPAADRTGPPSKSQ